MRTFGSENSREKGIQMYRNATEELAQGLPTSHATSVNVSNGWGEFSSHAVVPKPLTKKARVSRFIKQHAANSANSGDHPLILLFLKSAENRTNEVEFEHVLDHPNYVPNDRLLVRHNNEIVGHVRLDRRKLRFGKTSIDSATITELAALPEFDYSGCKQLMVDASIDRCESTRCTLVTLSESQCTLADLDGEWAAIDIGERFTVSPLDILSAMESMFLIGNDGSRKSREQYLTRPMRMVERDQVERLYEKATKKSRGAVIRDHEYWHWLTSRRSHDRAYVAVQVNRDGSEKVVAYAILRKAEILEIIADAEHSLAIFSVLRRISLDALEKGCHTLTIGDSASVRNPIVDRLMTIARCPGQPQKIMVRATSHERLIKEMSAELALAAHAEGLSTGTKLGIEVEGQSFTIQLLRHKLRIEKKASRSRLVISKATFTKLVLGGFDVAQAINQGHLTATTQVAAVIAQKLFPFRPFLRMPFEDRMAMPIKR